MKEWILPAIATFISWGLWAYLPKLTIKYIDSRSAMVYQVLGGILIGLGMMISLRFRVEFNPPGFLLGVATGLLGFFGAYTYLITVSKAPVSLVAPITSLYPLLAIILGYFFLHETISLKQGIGVLLSIIAIVLIST